MLEYYPLEQLENRLQVTKVRIGQVRRKILVEMFVASFFVAFFTMMLFTLDLSSWSFVPLIMNIIAWLIWISWHVRHGFRVWRTREFTPEELSDEYRAYQFRLRHVARFELVIDVLTGVQFLSIAVLLAAGQLFAFSEGF